MMSVTWWGYYDCPDCGGSVSDVQCPTCLKRAEDERKNIKVTYTQTDQWIQCKDRLPEDKQRVIYYFDMVGIHMGRYDASSNTFHGPSGFLQEDVTHWMPAPTAPK